MKTKQIHIRCNATFLSKIKKRAKLEQTTMNIMIKKLITKHLEKNKPEAYIIREGENATDLIKKLGGVIVPEDCYINYLGIVERKN
jgi:hypothetical protein